MKVVYSPEHRLHAPRAEFEKSRFQPPFEHAGRAEVIRAALAADANFEIIAPDVWGTGLIEAVHDPGLVRFLAGAWDAYQLECGPTHDVVPDVFRHPGVMEGMGPGREPGPVSNSSA